MTTGFTDLTAQILRVSNALSVWTQDEAMSFARRLAPEGSAVFWDCESGDRWISVTGGGDIAVVFVPYPLAIVTSRARQLTDPGVCVVKSDDWGASHYGLSAHCFHTVFGESDLAIVEGSMSEDSQGSGETVYETIDDENRAMIAGLSLSDLLYFTN